MKNKIMAVLLTAVMALSMTACGGGAELKETGGNEKTSQKEEVTYETILNEYTQKVTEKASRLVEEYNKESDECGGDINKLAELSYNKISSLAEVSNEGAAKMAELMDKNGDTSHNYEEWAAKLNDVYMEQAKLITAAYTESVKGQ